MSILKQKKRILTVLFAKVQILALSLFITSCLPDPLEVKDIPAVEPEIVVATQIIPDGGLLVLLTKTFGALEAGDGSDPVDLLNKIAVNDAKVILQGPDGSYALNFEERGIYTGLEIPFREGEEYTLRVESASLGSVEATTTVMPQVRFDNLRADLFYNDAGNSFAQIAYSLRDPEGFNYYMINVQEVELEDVRRNAINPRAFTRIFEDKEFAGGVASEQFRVSSRGYSEGDSIAVSLFNVSEEYYRFMEMRLDNRYSFLEFVSEPVNYPSNIKGGRGFFNLSVPDFRFFVLGKEIGEE